MPRACEEVAGIIVGCFGAHVQRRFERAPGEVGSKSHVRLDTIADRVGRNRPRGDAPAERADLRDRSRMNGIRVVVAAQFDAHVEIERRQQQHRQCGPQPKSLPRPMMAGSKGR